MSVRLLGHSKVNCILVQFRHEIICAHGLSHGSLCGTLASTDFGTSGV